MRIIDEKQHGINYWSIRSMYVNRNGSGKGVVKFMDLMVKPLVETNGNILEVPEDKAWKLAQQLYPKWIAKRKFENWQEVVNYLQCNCYANGNKAKYFTGSINNDGKRLHLKVEY